VKDINRRPKEREGGMHHILKETPCGSTEAIEKEHEAQTKAKR